MDLSAIAGWVGLEPTAERMDRLAWATPFVMAAAEVVRELPCAPDEIPSAGRNPVPLRHQIPARTAVATRPHELGAIEAALAIRRGELSPAELLASCREQIGRTDPAIHAFVRTAVDTAPQDGVLHGIPYAAKDLVDTADVACEYGSTAFTGRVASTDATVVTRIRAAGGVLTGKTATHEIAYGMSTPGVRNPWNLEKMVSGSSGGSAAALAARQVPLALGTDTGGSLRVPSAFCGTTAIKPTYGLVPSTGVMTLAQSFDTVGPMARSAQDCWLLLRVLTGQAPAEPDAVVADIEQVRVGVADIATPDQLAVAETLRGLGARLVDMQLPPLDIAQAVGTVLAVVEASTEFRGHLSGEAQFSDETQSMLEAGLTVPVADFLHAQRVRAAIRRTYVALFADVDVILMPTSPVTDLPHGASDVDGVPLIPVLTRFTFLANLTGLPAIAFPCGFTSAGMPVGAQLMGSAGSEALLAAVAGAYQDVTDWTARKPVESLRSSSTATSASAATAAKK
nr:amidase [Kibdelosporangium sp. MJ126-NF4]